MLHLMVDLETMGTSYDAPVLAIGAVFFEPSTGEIGERFYDAIDIEDACRYGHPSGSTIKFWMMQGDDARAAAIAGNKSSKEVFDAFRAFCLTRGDRIKPWGNGATFDIAILDYAFPKITGQASPWRFFNVRDCRTIKDIAGDIAAFPHPRAGTHHQALDDAVFQAQWVSYYWQTLQRAAVAKADGCDV
ncbi:MULTISPECIES: 3'-5' exonuclease [unclassified Chelatococcus]|uniref:3'-5' exonuclease n=1 Tax=unclassified Chelatococcus TaxID=2638111 RepID=UPI001BCF3558|nr:MULTISPECIES: 3'-5' exonuclease [unclassified Chelatococcus]MBS7737731.1 3'-5' exoribonuclease [Chelatococcus sp. HY11]MBX3547219.1 3'-5' exoribonuclease [Chelatococcus sp.]MCO5077141.1 3'-5' exoribonuclease [Chelatococcus sp.]